MANRILSQSNELEGEIIDCGQYRIGYFIRKNFEKSNDNEDALFFLGSKTGLVAGVADGVGGYPRGRDASEIAAKGVLDYFGGKGFSDLQVLENIETINQSIRDLKVGARTTLSTAIIKDHELKIYSIGDSEALFCNTKGFLIYSNIPQSPVGYGVHGGYIDQKESLDDPERHLVNHLLGDEILRFEASSWIPFKKGHTLLVGSDGLFDNLNHENILEIIGGGAFDEAFEALKKNCSVESGELKKDDDISFILIRRVRSE